MIHRAIGITCGIGSLLIGARQAGFEVVGNIEWRKYYHAKDSYDRNTFTENFRGAIFKEHYEDLTLDEIERMMDATLALSHPECGHFSNLNTFQKKEMMKDPCDIPLAIDLVSKLKPRFFAMDDLPKSFVAYPISEYAKKLPDYDLFPELVSNWGYGNVQRQRNRFFMVGALKREKWAFVPGEVAPKDLSVESVIGDLPEPRAGSNYPNHDPCTLDELGQRSLHMRYRGDRPTYRDIAEHARTMRKGEIFQYHAADGTKKMKIGTRVEYWEGDRGASVQCGTSYKIHPIRLTPLTIRERARIQGFPDDFVFYGAKLNGNGEYNYDRNGHMTKQTGKAMPVQFSRYVSEQVMSFISGQNFESSGQRLLRPNSDVNYAKQWYCENVGYADQARACGACWLYAGCTIRQKKYRIGEPARGGQKDPFAPGIVSEPGSIDSEVTVTPSFVRPEDEPAPTPPAVRRPREERTTPALPRPSRRFADLPREEEYDL